MARRRIRKRRDRIYLALVILALLISISISAAISDITGTFNTNLFVTLTIILIVIFGAGMIVFSLPVVKGKMGEARVNSVLKKLAKRHGGYVVHDVTIPGENGKTSQIDHVLITEYGVFVVETKNYAGRIYGSEKQREWTQVLAYGNTKNKLYNPVIQNGTHIYRLKELLPEGIKMYSVVVFVRADINNVDSDYVYTLYDLKHLLDDRNEEIDGLVLEECYNMLMIHKLNPTKTNKEHVQEIRQMKKDIDNNICPRCGGKLVLRTSKSGNNFYGCENYPNCKFTKKVD